MRVHGNSRNQFGFMLRRSTTDVIFKSREVQKEIILTFIDLTKVYDRVLTRTHMFYFVMVKK